MSGAVAYLLPSRWVAFDPAAIYTDLVEAKAAVMSLKAVPFQRDWVDKLQEIQLKIEVAGTSRIEGAEFTEPELDGAIAGSTPAEDLLTRRSARFLNWCSNATPRSAITIR